MVDPVAGDVFVDLVFEDGFLFFEVANINSTFAAHNLQISFDHPVLGIDGRDVTELGVFKRLSWLAPGKRVRVLIDAVGPFYARRPRSRMKISLQWKMNGASFKSVIGHDIRAYRDLPHLISPAPRHADSRSL